MDRAEMTGALEAVVFAAGEPISWKQLRAIFGRLWVHEPDDRRKELLDELKTVLNELESSWTLADATRGFGLVKVAEGVSFRSNPLYADALRAMREQRPQRLSRAALETLSIIAYRQPATKPEIDHIRGVDCGGTIRMLLDRSLIRIMGKKEEPGRPLMYGTTKQFLSFFNLPSLAQLPSLREVNELSEEAQEELRAFEGIADLGELQQSAKKLKLDAEPAIGQLDQAMHGLSSTERSTREALAAEGIQLEEDDEEGDPGSD